MSWSIVGQCAECGKAVWGKNNWGDGERPTRQSCSCKTEKPPVEATHESPPVTSSGDVLPVESGEVKA